MGDIVEQPLATAEVRTAEAIAVSGDGPSSKRQKLTHAATPDQRGVRPGIAPVKKE